MTKPTTLKTAGRALVALPVFALAGLATPAFADCGAIDKDVRAALASGKVESYVALNQAMLAEPSCNGDYREKVGRVLALSSLKALQVRLGLDSAKYQAADVVAAARFGRPGQVMLALGDAYYAAKDYDHAVPALEEAIDDIRNARLNPKAPGKDVEIRLFKRAYQARALAQSYVKFARVEGKPAGLSSRTFRSFEVEAVPVPVRFNYKESTLTPEGTAAAADILAYLNSEGVKKIRIIGHTDPVGGDAYNANLSKSRAKAIKDYLLSYGYAGTVEVVGKGEKEPFEPDDVSKYSEDELYAFDRRVEYQVVE